MIDPRDSIRFDMVSLFSGGDGMERRFQWLALAAHLEREVELAEEELLILGKVPRDAWVDQSELEARFAADRIARLLETGLLISDHTAYSAHRAADERIRATNWYTPAAILHRFGRWGDVESGRTAKDAGLGSMVDMAARLGPPPSESVSRTDARLTIPLQPPRETAFDNLLRSRVTCRNFDRSRAIPIDKFAQVVHRTFAAQARVEIKPGVAVIKRNSPSGGGLHPCGVYFLIRAVESLEAGLYHYDCLSHALEQIEPLSEPALSRLAEIFVAGQTNFAEAPALAIVTARFPRLFWKYREHSKAYRVTILDAAHLLQTLHLSAAEAGLASFVTAAINEKNIETSLGIDPMIDGPLAVAGIGFRSSIQRDTELDPLHRVWAAPVPT